MEAAILQDIRIQICRGVIHIGGGRRNEQKRNSSPGKSARETNMKRKRESPN